MVKTTKPPIPQHIAIIMDGNGRWAKQRHLPRTVGHAKGAAVVRDLVKSCADMGVHYLTLYAFSTENWQRPTDEVSTLMGLFIQYLEKEMTNMRAEGVRLRVLGDISRFPPELQQRIRDAEADTLDQPKITLNVAANYGGRWDIVQAVQAWQRAHPGADASQLTESNFGQYLSTAGMPDVDLMIRTGGESRISNFLLWQAAYAELYFTPTLWPDFNTSELDKALQWFAGRDRRYGSVAA
nr:polyprenyl diphosphate synthase [uncultured Limnohabitans sp.]